MKSKNNASFLLLLLIIETASSQDCGKVYITKPTKLIVGTDFREAYPGQWPWLVPLFHQNKYLCGSSLISDKHVLTAAHCAINKNPSDLHLLPGRFNLSNDNEQNFVKVNVVQSYIHQNYSDSIQTYQSAGDIAILRFRPSVRFTDYIQPVCLPKPSSNVVNLQGFTAGYGLYDRSVSHEDKPRYASLYAISDHDCIYLSPEYIKVLSKKSFCAKNIHQSSAPCNGDYGGGYFAQSLGDSGVLTVFGVMSHAVSQFCFQKDYTVFTHVIEYLDWIRAKMKDTSEFRVEPCKVQSCGPKEDCFAVNGKETCRCKKGFRGAPPRCVQCKTDGDCKRGQTCKDDVCIEIDPCLTTSCGPFAKCEVRNGDGVCSCQYFGQYPHCSQFECDSDDKCPFNKVCSSEGQCALPCDLDVCGTNAVCSPTFLRNYSCKCKSGYEGNPESFCKQTDGAGSNGAGPPRTDPCSPSTCGPNSRCSQSYGQAVCSCFTGFYGDPPNCRQNECVTNSHCSNTEVCSNGKCVDPCDLSPCGTNAVCSRIYGISYSCSCKSGFEGDAYEGCSRRTTTTTTKRTTTLSPCFGIDCGPYADCIPLNGVANCRCFPGHFGKPPNCTIHECVSNLDCPENLVCSALTKKCVPVCDAEPCAESADCIPIYDRKYKCKCWPGYVGNANQYCAPTAAVTERTTTVSTAQEIEMQKPRKLKTMCFIKKGISKSSQKIDCEH